jgi:hypothetical protein
MLLILLIYLSSVAMWANYVTLNTLEIIEIALLINTGHKAKYLYTILVLTITYSHQAMA